MFSLYSENGVSIPYAVYGIRSQANVAVLVLCRPKHFCRRLQFVYDSYDVDRGFQVSGRHCQCHRRQGRRDVVDWISRVPTHNLIWSTFILNMCLILRPVTCRELNSL